MVCFLSFPPNVFKARLITCKQNHSNEMARKGISLNKDVLLTPGSQKWRPNGRLCSRWRLSCWNPSWPLFQVLDFARVSQNSCLELSSSSLSLENWTLNFEPTGLLKQQQNKNKQKKWKNKQTNTDRPCLYHRNCGTGAGGYLWFWGWSIYTANSRSARSS